MIIYTRGSKLEFSWRISLAASTKERECTYQFIQTAAAAVERSGAAPIEEAPIARDRSVGTQSPDGLA